MLPPVRGKAAAGFTLARQGASIICDNAASAARSAHALQWREAPVQVLVRDNNVDQALRALKKKMQREGVFREMKQRRSYEKPSERRTRERAEAIRRARKLVRKQAIREGLLPAPAKKKLPERRPPLPQIASKECA